MPCDCEVSCISGVIPLEEGHQPANGKAFMSLLLIRGLEFCSQDVVAYSPPYTCSHHFHIIVGNLEVQTESGEKTKKKVHFRTVDNPFPNQASFWLHHAIQISALFSKESL